MEKNNLTNKAIKMMENTVKTGVCCINSIAEAAAILAHIDAQNERIAELEAAHDKVGAWMINQDRLYGDTLEINADEFEEAAQLLGVSWREAVETFEDWE